MGNSSEAIESFVEKAPNFFHRLSIKKSKI